MSELIVSFLQRRIFLPRGDKTLVGWARVSNWPCAVDPVSGTEVSRAKSADDVIGSMTTSSTGGPEDVPDSGHPVAVTGNRPSSGSVSKTHSGRIDWKMFQEEVCTLSSAVYHLF